MPKVARIGDIGSGHACHFPPTPITSGSSFVKIDGVPVACVGDSLVPHGCPTCPAPPHGRSIAQGSSIVKINGKPVARVGDAIDCGGSITTGSSLVNMD